MRKLLNFLFNTNIPSEAERERIHKWVEGFAIKIKRKGETGVELDLDSFRNSPEVKAQYEAALDYPKRHKGE